MRKENKSNSILYAVIVSLVVVSLFLGIQWYQKYYGESYKKAVSSEVNDKCATPPEYTDEAWKEHMSHHPDRYRECLS